MFICTHLLSVNTIKLEKYVDNRQVRKIVVEKMGVRRKFHATYIVKWVAAYFASVTVVKMSRKSDKYRENDGDP